MALNESVVGLFDELCNIQLKNTPRVHFIQPKNDKDHSKKLLKQKLYNSLFQAIKEIDLHKNDKTSPVPKEIDRILCHAFNLRLQRRFEEASHLEQLLDKLMNLKNKNHKIEPVLCFISALTNSSEPNNNNMKCNPLTKIPKVYADPNMELFLPDGPLYYGDDKTTVPDRQWYMHYPRHIFESVQPLFKNTELSQKSVFDLSPGCSLSGDGLFNIKGYLDDEYEKDNRYTLFGALVQSKITSLDVKLEFPEIISDNFLPEIKIPKTISTGQISEDEGFVETKSEFSSSVTSDSSQDVENIWDKALTYTLNKHYTWERIGCEPNKTENPFLTEAGCEAYNQVCLYRNRQIALLCSEVVLPSQFEITKQTLVTDVLNLMLGIPSKTFLFDTNLDMFAFKYGVYVTGHSTESLSEFLLDFIICGSTYKKLEQFSEPLKLDSLYEAGLVFQAFTTAVRKVLQHYRGAILAISKDSTLLDIKCKCNRLFSQVQYLVNLCEYRSKLPDSDSGCFPKGIELISLLYKETLEANSTDNYPMMLSILQTTCGPFILFLQNWVFHGIFQDLYGEFTIQVNNRFLESRDRQYWTSCYIMTTKHVEDCVPVFLSDIANNIIVCGKSLNLLKLCSPTHFMCNVNDQEIPRVTITFSDEELITIDIQSQMYVGRMRQVARQVTFTRKEKQRRVEQARLELVEKAHKIKSGQLKAFQNLLLNQKRAEDLKKRQEFERLKNQMNEDLMRRASKLEDQKAGDKKYMDSFTKREENMTEEELKLEEQAKEEIIAYYQELGEEAAKREQKALWKVRRARLDIERSEFLLNEADKWKKEYEEFQFAENLLKETEPELPLWVTESGSSTPVSSISSFAKWKDREIVLPISDPEHIAKNDNPPLESEIQDVDLKDVVSKSESTSDPNDIELIQKASGDAEKDTSNKTPKEDMTETTKESSVDNNEKDNDVAASLIVKLDEQADESANINEVTDEETPLITRKTKSGKTSNSERDFEKNSPGNDHTETENNELDSVSSKSPTKTPVKTHVKMNDSISATSETEPSPEKHHVKMLEYSSVSQETTEDSLSKAAVKPVAHKHATLETVEEISKVSTKSVKNQHFSKESTQVDEKSTIRMSQDQYSTKESEPGNEFQFPKLKPGCHYASEQSKEHEWKIKAENVFGHSSQMSHSYRSIIPKLKQFANKHVSFESDIKDFRIKPKIRISKTHSVNKQSDITDAVVGPKIRSNVNLDFHPSKQSTFIDQDKIRSDKFKEQNVFGHASDSSVQKLLYGEQTKANEDELKEFKQLLPKNEWMSLPVEPYETDYDCFDHFPNVDLMSSVPLPGLGGLGNYGVSHHEDVEKYKYMSLPSVLKQSMMTPLKAQIGLVNKCVVEHFFTELKLDDQFETLRRYLLMEDGDFSQILSDILFDKLATNPLPQEMLNPIYLNGVLKKSLESSINSNDKYAENLTFYLKSTPKSFVFNAHDTLDCLELRYKVDWPINIILTDAYMSKYGQVFSFMLQLKRMAWVLKDIWYRLKRDSLIKKAGNSSQFRQLQLFRQEMQHFVKVMQGYIANQIIHVTWQEFQDSLSKDVQDLDDLYKVHGQYLEKAIFRCLLNKKAKPVMKLIQDIFSLILKFRIQLLTGSWKETEDSRNMVHSNFPQMSVSYKAFRQFSVFLFGVVHKLAIRGYQPHLQELLLRLNFNNYYKD